MVYVQSKEGHVYQTDNPESWSDCKRLTEKAGKELYREQAKEQLRNILKPGDTVCTILRSCSRSGMSREISLVVVKDGETCDITYLAARAMSDRVGKREGIIVGGCGMDMGFHLVYNLGYTLWPKGTPEPHGTRNGVPDRDGGYALKHRWI